MTPITIGHLDICNPQRRSHFPAPSDFDTNYIFCHMINCAGTFDHHISLNKMGKLIEIGMPVWGGEILTNGCRAKIGPTLAHP